MYSAVDSPDAGPEEIAPSSALKLRAACPPSVFKNTPQIRTLCVFLSINHIEFVEGSADVFIWIHWMLSVCYFKSVELVDCRRIFIKRWYLPFCITSV